MMRNVDRVPRFWWIVAAVAAFAGAPGHVSAQALSSFPIVGVVQDETGGVLQEAAVELVNAAGVVLETVVTDANGAFHFTAVAVGRYDVRVRMEGFKPISTQIRVATRAPASLKVVLSLAQLAEDVTVSNRDTLTTRAGDNRDAIVLDPEALANLPIFDQDVVAAASRFLDQGALGSGGATLIVDGMESTSLGVSASSIDHIKINDDPYSAEYARSGRGRIEIVTKAGAQAYHGSTTITMRDAKLNGRDPFAVARAPEQRRIYEGSVSGPVLSGKTTSFLASFDRREEDVQAVIFATNLSGLIQANVPQPRRSAQLSASITHQQGAKNTISLRYTHEGDTTRNQGVGGTTLLEAGGTSRSYEDQVVIGHRSILSKTLIHEARVTLGAEGGSTTSLNSGVRIVVADAFTAGGGQSDRSSSQHRVGVTDSLTYVSGKHLLKGGLNIPEWNRRRNDDLTNIGGTFTFATLADYQSGRPISFVQQRGDGSLVFVEKNFGLFLQDQIQARTDLSLSVGLRYDWQNHVTDHNNVGPRASFAYAPKAHHGTVIRGGAGVFFDRLEGGAVADWLHSTEGRLVRYVIVNPSYPDAFASGDATITPPSLVQLRSGVVLPSTVQYGLGVERQLSKSTTLAVNYVGTHGSHLFRSRDLNAPLAPLYTARPDPSHGVIRQIESTGRQTTDSIQLTLRGRVTRFFDGSVQYALARGRNDTSGINAFPPNNYDLSGEWGRADFDQRHRFDLLGRLRGRRLPALGIALSLYSGRPYSLRTGHDDFNTGQLNARPAGVGRNTLTGPGYADLDLRWSRDIALPAATKDNAKSITLGIDAFNVLNHVNYSSFVGNLSSPFFGRPLSAQPARRLQASVRFKF